MYSFISAYPLGEAIAGYNKPLFIEFEDCSPVQSPFILMSYIDMLCMNLRNQYAMDKLLYCLIMIKYFISKFSVNYLKY